MGRETRHRILETSARLFRERGYDGTSVASVLAECGVNSGSLYYFFESKEELAESVVELCHQQVGARLLDPAEEATRDPVGRVTALLGLIRDDLESRAGGDGALVGLLAAELGDRRPAIRGAAERYHRAVAGRVRGWLDEAGPQLPSWLDRGGFADFLATVIQGGLLRASAAGVPDCFDAAVAEATQYLGLLEDAARRERSGEAVRVSGVSVEVDRTGSSGDWRSW